MDILSQKQETTLPTLMGEVKLKVPSLTRRLEIERKRTAYSGGYMVLSNLGADLSEIFAFLDVVMLSCENMARRENDSSSWNYDDIPEYDLDKLEDAYKKASDWLDSFRKPVVTEQNNVG